ncbi:dioxygenase [Neisseria sp. Dent CA1/247]|uniref:Dioxygenase n=1 Tax=Neisseria zoodegmatis TaxID=326523 RepID=A0AB38DQ18_9NEIS|nr:MULTISPECIES: dioxygenase [Neisseria]MDO5068761.1 dioxygenase [Neisseria zoodegmatis]OSI09707.1 dioxygenase [Neisseria zoodegmatis]UOO77716.1 dioxygenase [Neisseria sp. Dent CA1/247]SNU79510.1 Putative ring dioxygenase subunit beta [Neisseria zoodegmatis]
MSPLLEWISTETPAAVAETLDFFLYECSLDEAPGKEEVEAWRDVLQKRGGKFARLAAQCQTWLDEEC